VGHQDGPRRWGLRKPRRGMDGTNLAWKEKMREVARSLGDLERGREIWSA